VDQGLGRDDWPEVFLCDYKSVLEQQTTARRVAGYSIHKKPTDGFAGTHFRERL